MGQIALCGRKMLITSIQGPQGPQGDWLVEVITLLPQDMVECMALKKWAHCIHQKTPLDDDWLVDCRLENFNEQEKLPISKCKSTTHGVCSIVNLVDERVKQFESEWAAYLHHV